MSSQRSSRAATGVLVLLIGRRSVVGRARLTPAARTTVSCLAPDTGHLRQPASQALLQLQHAVFCHAPREEQTSKTAGTASDLPLSTVSSRPTAPVLPVSVKTGKGSADWRTLDGDTVERCSPRGHWTVIQRRDAALEGTGRSYSGEMHHWRTLDGDTAERCSTGGNWTVIQRRDAALEGTGR